MKKQHTSPCKACPWRKNSASGWLGSASPMEFLQTSEAEHRMPCHLHVDYEDEDWEEKAQLAPQCAGRAIHFANRCKHAKNPDLIRLAPERDAVFTHPQEFIDHHTLGDSKPRIRILGQLVVEG